MSSLHCYGDSLLGQWYPEAITPSTQLVSEPTIGYHVVDTRLDTGSITENDGISNLVITSSNDNLLIEEADRFSISNEYLLSHINVYVNTNVGRIWDDHISNWHKQFETGIDLVTMIRSVINRGEIERLENKNIILREIFWQDYHFKLVTGLNLLIEKEGQYYKLSYPQLDIDCIEETEKKVLDAFYEEFAFIWKVYGTESDENLTQAAIELKRKILELVTEVHSSGV